MTKPARPLPTQQEVLGWIRGERRNWGRWGKDDQRGTVNLITPARRAAAARLVTSGRSVSLSRPFPTTPGLNNALPAHHYMKTMARGRGGFAADYYGIFYHGVASTHLDALCHTWDDEHAMWNGRDPKKEITFDGATFGSVEHWAEGIITRGVMLEVPRHRGTPCVTQEDPVHGWELARFSVSATSSSSPATPCASTRAARSGRRRIPTAPTACPSVRARSTARGCT